MAKFGPLIYDFKMFFLVLVSLHSRLIFLLKSFCFISSSLGDGCVDFLMVTEKSQI